MLPCITTCNSVLQAKDKADKGKAAKAAPAKKEGGGGKAKKKVTISDSALCIASYLLYISAS